MYQVIGAGALWIRCSVWEDWCEQVNIRSMPKCSLPIVCGVNYLYSMIYLMFDLQDEDAAWLGTVGTEKQDFS